MPLVALALLALLAPAEAGRKKKKRAAPAPVEAPVPEGSVVLPCPYAPDRSFTWDMRSTGSNPATGTVTFTGREGPSGTVHVRIETTVERPARLSSSVVDEALARLPAESAPIVSFEPATRALTVVNLPTVQAAIQPALEAVLAERYADADPTRLAYTRQLARDPGMLGSAVLQGKAVLLLHTCAEAPVDQKLEQAIYMPAPVGDAPLDALSTYLVRVEGDRVVIEASEASLPGAMGVLVDGMVARDLLDAELADDLRHFQMATSARTEVTLADGVVRTSTSTMTLTGSGVGDSDDTRVFTLRAD